MKVPSAITSQLKEWRALKIKRVGIRNAIKSHEALIRYYRCKNKRRAKAHYSTYLKFNAKSFK